MRRLTLLLALFFAVLIYVMAIAPRVHATFPGSNGLITYAQLNADGSTANVFIANPDGSNPQQVLLTNPAESFGVPIWSPDGTKLLISHTIRCDNLGNCLFQPATVKPDGTEFNQLVPPNPPGSTSAGIDCNAWSRDGTLILCSFPGAQPGVFSIRASDGGDPVRLTMYPFGPNCNACDDPQDVSPDGSQFVFLRFRRENFGTTPAVTEQVALFVENTDGTGLRQVTPYGVAAQHERASAKWSPDGTQIISGMHNGNLFVVRLDGTGLTMIKLQVGTQKYFAFEPHFSPDGTRIIFGMFINGGEGIYTANPDGSDVKQVTFTMDFATPFNGPDWQCASSCVQ
jgi:Tol biopolymer transport system component